MSKAAQLLDAILNEKGFRTDSELAQALDIEPANLSRLRHGRRPVSDGMVICVHELTGWEIRDIKRSLGMRCHDQVLTPD